MSLTEGPPINKYIQKDNYIHMKCELITYMGGNPGKRPTTSSSGVNVQKFTVGNPISYCLHMEFICQTQLCVETFKLM